MHAKIWSIHLHEFRYTEPSVLPVEPGSGKNALEFHFDTKMSADAKHDLVWLEISIRAVSVFDQQETAYIRMSTVYEINGAADWLKKASQGESREHAMLQRLAQEAVAHTRAELRTRGAGTILDEAIFPLVNPLQGG